MQSNYSLKNEMSLMHYSAVYYVILCHVITMSYFSKVSKPVH